MNVTASAAGYIYYLQAFGLVVSGTPVTADIMPTDGSVGTEALMAGALGVADAKSTSPAVQTYTAYQASILNLAVPSS